MRSIFLSRGDGWFYRLEVPTGASQAVVEEGKRQLRRYAKREIDFKTFQGMLDTLDARVFCGSGLYYQDVLPREIESL